MQIFCIRPHKFAHLCNMFQNWYKIFETHLNHFALAFKIFFCIGFALALHFNVNILHRNNTVLQIYATYFKIDTIYLHLFQQNICQKCFILLKIKTKCQKNRYQVYDFVIAKIEYIIFNNVKFWTKFSGNRLWNTSALNSTNFGVSWWVSTAIFCVSSMLLFLLIFNSFL